MRNKNLDNFLESALYAFDLADKGASKNDHDKANLILCGKESLLINELGLNLEDLSDSAKFDTILELTEAYRNDESRYESLVTYVDSLR